MVENSKLVMTFKNRIGKNIFKKNNHTLVEAVDAQIINSQTDDYDLIL